jgi:hypoxanthine phosphoribosyltransferase
MSFTETVHIKNNSFSKYMSKNEIENIVIGVANNINEFYKNSTNENSPLIIIGILNGSFMFLSDLVKNINLCCEIHFIKVSSYEGTESTGSITNIIGLNQDISDKNVLIVEDIIDTGLTINNLMDKLIQQNPQSLNACSMLWKTEKYKGRDLNTNFIGKSIPNKFVIGYGLDYDNFGRNLPEIYTIV